MAPLELAEFLRTEVASVIIPDDLDTNEHVQQAVQAMNALTAYYSYFKEMETLARVMKRQAKRNRAEADHLLSIEEVFEAYKKICSQNYECITRQMTLKRLSLDEAKMLSRVV